MTDPRWQDELSASIRTLQIVVGSLVVGCVVFLVIAVVMAAQVGPPAGPRQSMMTYLGVGFALVVLAARAIVPGMILARGRRAILRGTWRPPEASAGHSSLLELLERTGEAGKLWLVLFTRTIVACAIVEGAAFLVLVAYLLEHSPLSLVVASVLILVIAVDFPTRARAIRWVEDQLTLLDDERQLGR